MNWDWQEYVAVGLGLLVVGLFGCLIYATILEVDTCKAAGGHVVTKSGVGVGMSTGGSPAVVTTAISFCISEDGRILP